jgi:hypothetical protein
MVNRQNDILAKWQIDKNGQEGQLKNGKWAK